MTSWHIVVSNHILFVLAVAAFAFYLPIHMRMGSDKNGRLYTHADTDHPITVALKTFLRSMSWLVVYMLAYWVVDLGHAIGWLPQSWSGVWGWAVFAAGWAMVEFFLTIFYQKKLLPNKQKREAAHHQPQFRTRAETTRDAESVLRDLYELQHRYGGEITVSPITEDDDDDGHCDPHTTSITRGPWLV